MLTLSSIVVFVVGGLSGFLLAALLQIAHKSDKRRPMLDSGGLHPLDVPTR